MRGPGLAPFPGRCHHGIAEGASPSLRYGSVLDTECLSPSIWALVGYVAPMDAIAEHADGVLVHVHVVPGASRSEIKGRHGDAIKVRVAAPAEGGRANRAVVKLLSSATGGRASIASGETSRSKSVVIRGVGRADVVARLDP